jgi:hypothetical protein
MTLHCLGWVFLRVSIYYEVLILSMNPEPNRPIIGTSILIGYAIAYKVIIKKVFLFISNFLTSY